MKKRLSPVSPASECADPSVREGADALQEEPYFFTEDDGLHLDPDPDPKTFSD